jgi:hypothetical protein
MSLNLKQLFDVFDYSHELFSFCEATTENAKIIFTIVSRLGENHASHNLYHSEMEGFPKSSPRQAEM